MKTIAKKAVNTTLLKQLNSGTKPTSQELFHYFPPAVQDRLLQNTLAESIVSTSSQVDPTTGQLFEGDRLIERVAQKHFGGENSKVDANYSDIYGNYSLKSYGEKVLQLYNYNNKDNCLSNSQNSNFLGSAIAGSTTRLKIASIIGLLGLIGYFMQFLHPLTLPKKYQLFLLVLPTMCLTKLKGLKSGVLTTSPNRLNRLK
ncbi:MAG: hypothetical protein U7127_01425 [Phormidium sp.]